MAFSVVCRTPLDAAAMKTAGLKRLPFCEGLFKTIAATAHLESPVYETPIAFDDLVCSWNASVPKDGRLGLRVQVRMESGWSAWYSLGSIVNGNPISAQEQRDTDGFVDVDTLKLTHPATAFRFRIFFKTSTRPIRLHLVAVSVSNGTMPASPTPLNPEPPVIELNLHPRSQMTENVEYRHDICSPTALAMVLDFWGHKLQTLAVAERVRDHRTGIFGHWPFNIAAAASYGLEAWVARLDSITDLQAEVAAGRPVIVSIAFDAGKLSGAPLLKTGGHLVVVAGFTESGDVVIYDPAAPDQASVRRVYKRAQFHRAWRVRKRGLAYLIRSPQSEQKMTIAVPVTDLYATPRHHSFSLNDPEHLSQLLYGEEVTVISTRGDWAKVRADEQPDFYEGGRWQGYPGWVNAAALRCGLPSPTNVVIRTRQALAQRGNDILVFSVGTRLQRLSQSGSASFVRLLDGSQAELPADSLYTPPVHVSAESRAQIVKTAELFLGTSYYWGGRAGVQPDSSVGVDCSGLVNLAYRIHNLDVPRDSYEQKLRSRSIAAAMLKPGDLIFLSESDRVKKITHVMIYTGGDGIIESRQSSGRVVRTLFKERFGKPLSKIEANDVVTDYSRAVPRRRIIYFGTYF